MWTHCKVIYSYLSVSQVKYPLWISHKNIWIVLLWPFPSVATPWQGSVASACTVNSPSNLGEPPLSHMAERTVCIKEQPETALRTATVLHRAVSLPNDFHYQFSEDSSFLFSWYTKHSCGLRGLCGWDYFFLFFYIPALPAIVLIKHLRNKRKGTRRRGDETAKMKADAHVSLVK